MHSDCATDQCLLISLHTTMSLLPITDILNSGCTALFVLDLVRPTRLVFSRRDSYNTCCLCRSDPFWKFPVTDLPLDVPVTAIRCGVNLEIGSTYILYGYFSGWMATDNERRALWLDECTLPVEINESDPVPRRFLERTC